MIKRIIFLVENKFSLRDYQRFGIELMQKNGFQVEAWELTPILYPEVLQVNSGSSPFTFEGFTIFSDKHELYNKLSSLLHSDFVITLIVYNFLTLGIYRALSKSQANYSVSFTGSFPFPMVKEGCLQILMGKIKDLAGFRRLEAWKRLCMRLPLWCVGVKPASLMFVAGEKYLIYRKYRRYPINKNTELLQIHGFDYDIYLKEKNNHCIERSIAVFIDEYFPFHPDYLIVKRESPVKADSYYKSINAFFDIVEERTGLEVVIAAHPRATYENLPDYYNGRKCIKGKTINLIRESKLALAHCSTAINFICLFYKPIIFMTCSDLDKSYEGGYIREYAKSFNKVPISIDRNNNIDWKQELMVSKASYDSYRRAYIKAKQSKDLPFWQIVANRLKDGS